MTKEREELKEKVKNIELEIRVGELERHNLYYFKENKRLNNDLRPFQILLKCFYVSLGFATVWTGYQYIQHLEPKIEIKEKLVAEAEVIERYEQEKKAKIGLEEEIKVYKGQVSELKKEINVYKNRVSDEQVSKQTALEEVSKLKKEIDKINDIVNQDTEYMRRALDSIRIAANHGDQSTIKGKISCSKGYRSNIPYSFLETVINKTLNEDYVIKKMKIVGTSSYPRSPKYDVRIEATLTKKGFSTYTIDGLDHVICSNHCVFQIYKSDEDYCPKFTSK